jgi:hypothetical protein
MKMTLALTAFSAFAAPTFGAECQSLDFTPYATAFVPCAQAAKLDVTALSKLDAPTVLSMCTVADCQSFFKQLSSLTCEVGGQPASAAAKACSSVALNNKTESSNSASTVAPKTTTGSSKADVQAGSKAANISTTPKPVVANAATTTISVSLMSAIVIAAALS